MSQTDRIYIDIGKIKVNRNKVDALARDATSLVTFEGGLTNPLPTNLCFALVFDKFQVGVVVQSKILTKRRPLATYLLTLETPWLQAFAIPAEIFADSNTWNDWKSPLTEHLVLTYFEPRIVISPTGDGDKNSVKVSLNLSRKGPNGSANTGHTSIISLRPTC